MANNFVRPATPSQRINDALSLIMSYSGIAGDHHKQWVLDQVVRALAQSPAKYHQWVRTSKGEWDEREHAYEYDWDEGIPP